MKLKSSMIVRLLFIALLVVTLGGGVSFAHPIPTLSVEAEFHPERQFTLRVNLDPRLFLAREPTTLPPLPPSWYLDQNSIALAQTAEQAKAFVNRNLSFKLGDTPLKPEWTISAIDSVSTFPLSLNSAETHLMAEYSGPLPSDPGNFVLTRTKDCPISLILVCSYDGRAESVPQAIMEGESSRGISPIPPGAATSAPMMTASAPPSPVFSSPSLWGRLAQAWADYLPLALVLGYLALLRWPVAALSWLACNVAHLLIWAGQQAGLLPSAPGWMGLLFWVALGCAVAQTAFIRRWGPGLLTSFAAAGACQALAQPATTTTGSLWSASGLLALHQALGAILVAALGLVLWVKPRALAEQT